MKVIKIIGKAVFVLIVLSMLYLNLALMQHVLIQLKIVQYNQAVIYEAITK